MSPMATRHERERRDALFEEARAIFEASKAEFEALQKAVKKTMAEGRALSGEILREQKRARDKLFLARVRLAKRLRGRK
jgi:hypothetical protein